MSFWAFHKLAYFSSKWANIYLSSVLGSTGGGFHQFQRLSRKSKKLKFFMTADLQENCHFGAFHIFTYFSPKWANIYFSSVLWSTGGCFHHFKRVFWRVEKIEDFPHPGPTWKMSFWAFHKFAYFSSKWANIYLSSVLGSTGGGFHQF